MARRCDRTIAQRLAQPKTQQARTGRRGAAVECREQRRCGFPCERCRDLEIAPRGRVETERGVRALDLERPYMRERGLLRGACIRE